MDNINSESENLYNKLVTKIVEERERQGISKAEMARQLNVHPVSYGDMEKGKIKFSAIRLFAALEILGLDIGLEEKKGKEEQFISENDVMKKLEKVDDLSRDINEIKQLLQNDIGEIKQLLKNLNNIKNLNLLLEIAKQLPDADENDNKTSE
ncbi:MAG: helix-turn-helix transcriptional regulator [Bacteroidia bacterium]|nr:helix-turn-helix transcriptional regulator [Bacteroidia bacterium]